MFRWWARSGKDLTMPPTKQRPRRLSDAQLEQLLALTADADSVELTRTALEYFSRNLDAAATA
jgi:transposase